MKELNWTSVYNGRLLHAFTGERREVENNRSIPRTVIQHKTLCGKWFRHLRTGWGASDFNFRKPHCKNCENKMEAK